MAELGLIMNSIWQDIGRQAPRVDTIEPDLARDYDDLQRAIEQVLRQMDELPD
jgi:hypothetical protein